MRIGHFVSFGIGGADRAAYRLIRAQKTLGLSPMVFASSASKPSLERVTADQDPLGKVLSIEAEYAQLGIRVETVENVEAIKRAELDILHTHRSGEDNFLLANLGQPGSARAIVETNFHGYLKTPADVRVFPSQSLLSFRRIRHRPNFFVIPNPVMPKLTTYDCRAKWGLGDKTVIGRISRSDKSTYSPKLLLVYKFLKSRHPGLRLVWCGSSSWARADAARLGLKDIVWVETDSNPEVVSSWYNSFDVYCHVPKLGETFGNTVAEAMMHAKPVLSLKGRPTFPQAQKEVLDDRRQFATSLAEFTLKLSRLINQSELGQTIGHRNLERAKGKFSEEKVAQDYLQVYDYALKELS